MPNSANANILIARYSEGVRDFTGLNLNEAKFYGSLHAPISLTHIILREADIRDGIFSHVDLANANLQHANLQRCRLQGSICGADFTKANLSHSRIGPGDRSNAVFAYADLSNSDFGGNQSLLKKHSVHENIDLRCSNLSNSKLTSDFTRADFRGSQLTGAQFKSGNQHWYRATLPGANFQGTDLQNQDLSGLDLCEANLNNANLTNANLSRANLSKANLTNANLSKANLSLADLEEADLRGAILEGTILDKANLLKTRLDAPPEGHDKDYYAWEIKNNQSKKRNFSKANLSYLDLKECDLSNSNLAQANLEKTDLRSSNLQGIQLDNANLSRACLAGTQLKRANLQEILARDTKFNGACLKEAILINADLTGASFVCTDLTAANLRGANCSGVDFSESNLLGTNLEGCTLENSVIYDADFFKAINVPNVLLSYLERQDSLAIRESYRFSVASKEEHQICVSQYGAEAGQYADYAIWFEQVPLLPSYQVPQQLLHTLFRLSPRIMGRQGIYISHFFFNIYYKPATLFKDLKLSKQEKEELILLGEAEVFELVRDFWIPDDGYDTIVQRPVLRKSSEEFAQWLIQASRIQISKDAEESSGHSSQKATDITLAATELADFAGKEFAICPLNDGDFNENWQYSAYAVISEHYLMFVLKHWEL